MMPLTTAPLLSRLHRRRAVNPAARYLDRPADTFTRWLQHKREDTTVAWSPERNTLPPLDTEDDLRYQIRLAAEDIIDGGYCATEREVAEARGLVGCEQHITQEICVILAAYHPTHEQPKLLPITEAQLNSWREQQRQQDEEEDA